MLGNDFHCKVLKAIFYQQRPAVKAASENAFWLVVADLGRQQWLRNVDGRAATRARPRAVYRLAGTEKATVVFRGHISRLMLLALQNN
jgi:hypothetical protein